MYVLFNKSVLIKNCFATILLMEFVFLKKLEFLLELYLSVSICGYIEVNKLKYFYSKLDTLIYQRVNRLRLLSNRFGKGVGKQLHQLHLHKALVVCSHAIIQLAKQGVY